MKKTKAQLQEKMNLLNIDELNTLYSYASEVDRDICDRMIESWHNRGLVKGYFGQKCRNIYKHRRVKYNDLLELYIYFCFIEFEDEVNDYEQQIFRDLANYYYIVGQKQVGKKFKNMTDTLYLALISRSNASGYNWAEYKEAKALNNTYQVQRAVTQEIQQGRKPNMFTSFIDKIFTKILKERLNINGKKISGSVDNNQIGINNMAIAEGILEADRDASVRFVAIMDDKTTPMCESLDGQIFKLTGTNEFVRWSDSLQSYHKYKCRGLVQGLNMPPIMDHFHWCRSTIEYVK